MIKHNITEIRRERKKRSYPEFQTHRQIADYCAKTFIPGESLWHTTDNSNNMGGVAARRAQAKQRLLGCQTGFPDAIVLYSGGRVLLIEIKAPKGTLQDKQIEMHFTLNLMGFIVVIVRSLDEFREIVRKYNVPCREIY